jgi:cyanophycinase
MTGHILLEGGAEFGGQMADPDRRAIELAGGWDAALGILPTAAAPDHNQQRAGQNGLRWFSSLGARRVTVIPLIDRASADQPAVAAAVQKSNLIYLLGGFPRYLGQTLRGSLSARALTEAYRAGAVVGGSSAGAMVVCQHYYDPETGAICEGLAFVPGACIIPHHNTFGRGWAVTLAAVLPGDVLIGIDEQTGMLDDAPPDRWTVYGKGEVTLYRNGIARHFRPGETFSL